MTKKIKKKIGELSLRELIKIIKTYCHKKDEKNHCCNCLIKRFNYCFFWECKKNLDKEVEI